MARAFTWPSVAPTDAEARPQAGASLRDTAGLAAAIGPELTRLFGARCSARLVESAPATGRHAVVARLRFPPDAAGAPPSATLSLLLSPADIASLLDILFGGVAGPALAPLPELPPGSASWATLARFLADAATRALAASGQRCQGPPEIPLRAAFQAGGEGQIHLRLDIDGTEATLGLMLEPATAAAPAEPPPDPELWRHRAQARTLDLALPVALRLAQTRMPVSQVAALSAGDILPLDRPAHVELLAGGRRLAMLPAADLAGPGRAGRDTADTTDNSPFPKDDA
jgi:flagellar motor switch/type III secretory pathway protein FliN